MTIGKAPHSSIRNTQVREPAEAPAEKFRRAMSDGSDGLVERPTYFGVQPKALGTLAERAAAALSPDKTIAGFRAAVDAYKKPSSLDYAIAPLYPIMAALWDAGEVVAIPTYTTGGALVDVVGAALSSAAEGVKALLSEGLQP